MYKKFKNHMSERGHKVTKKGDYITVVPNNNFLGYAKGFSFAEEIIQGTNLEGKVKLVFWEHCNEWIYFCKFRIL